MEEMITREQMEKLKKLQDYLKSLESVAVAFSSGVDSSYIAAKYSGKKTFTVGFFDKNNHFQLLTFEEGSDNI